MFAARAQLGEALGLRQVLQQNVLWSFFARAFQFIQGLLLLLDSFQELALALFEVARVLGIALLGQLQGPKLRVLSHQRCLLPAYLLILAPPGRIDHFGGVRKGLGAILD